MTDNDKSSSKQKVSPNSSPACWPMTMSDFDLHKGEIHALLGENGAGKTTLMNILYGLVSKPDCGRNPGQRAASCTVIRPKMPSTNGIGMVHQHFMLIPVFTVAENIMLGAETDHAALLWTYSSVSNWSRKELSKKLRAWMLDPDAMPSQETAGGRAAARGNRQGALPQGQDPDPG